MKRIMHLTLIFLFLSGCSNSWFGYEAIETIHDKESGLYIELARTFTFSSLETGVYVRDSDDVRTRLEDNPVLALSVRGMHEAYKFGKSPITGCYGLTANFRTGFILLPVWTDQRTRKKLCFELHYMEVKN